MVVAEPNKFGQILVSIFAILRLSETQVRLRPANNVKNRLAVPDPGGFLGHLLEKQVLNR